MCLLASGRKSEGTSFASILAIHLDLAMGAFALALHPLRMWEPLTHVSSIFADSNISRLERESILFGECKLMSLTLFIPKECMLMFKLALKVLLN